MFTIEGEKPNPRRGKRRWLRSIGEIVGGNYSKVFMMMMVMVFITQRIKDTDYDDDDGVHIHNIMNKRLRL